MIALRNFHFDQGKTFLYRSKNYSLFKFEASYHAMTMNSYLMEQAAEQGGIDGIDATGLTILLFVLTLIYMPK